MEEFKQFILKYFEKILVGHILLIAFFGTYFIEEKSIILNFYYLPVLVASYLLGRRMGLLTAVLSILAVLLFALIFPERFFGSRQILHDYALLSSWAGFLILASIVVGTLYELSERRMLDLRKAYIGILEILSKYLESTDRYTKGHSLRVSELSQEIAIAMGLQKVEVENIRAAGLLHDIGKIEISGEVLRKAADLSPEERALIDTHVAKGGNILSSVGAVLKEVVPIVLAHHKYFMSDFKAKADEKTKIPLGARIVAVADSFDAMVTDRPYRKGMPPWEALEELTAKAGTQFDPHVVEAFKRVIAEKMEKV
ncbi:MAG: HD domain-containing protein [Thermodesulfobacteriota bacterium]|nr:HD domain-containing protein [Thermodesulfobacteriota bacterium]